MNDPNVDRPLLFRSADALEARTARVDEPHVAPLNAWVRSLRKRLGPEAMVPWFDPADGGVEATILWLLEAPGPRSTLERGGSGIISCNNNDPTAKNTWTTREEAGIDRRQVVHWNAVPFYIGDAAKIRPSNAADAVAAGPLLAELLALLPRLRAVVVGGLKAQRIWRQHGPTDPRIKVILVGHPGPQHYNNNRDLHGQLVAAWRAAAVA